MTLQCHTDIITLTDGIIIESGDVKFAAGNES